MDIIKWLESNVRDLPRVISLEAYDKEIGAEKREEIEKKYRTYSSGLERERDREFDLYKYLNKNVKNSILGRLFEQLNESPNFTYTLNEMIASNEILRGTSCVDGRQTQIPPFLAEDLERYILTRSAMAHGGYRRQVTSGAMELYGVWDHGKDPKMSKEQVIDFVEIKGVPKHLFYHILKRVGDLGSIISDCKVGSMPYFLRDALVITRHFAEDVLDRAGIATFHGW